MTFRQEYFSFLEVPRGRAALSRGEFNIDGVFGSWVEELKAGGVGSGGNGWRVGVGVGRWLCDWGECDS